MSFITKLYSTIIDGKACILFVNDYQKDKKRKRNKVYRLLHLQTHIFHESGVFINNFFFSENIL